MTEKIDIIGEVIYRYDQNQEQQTPTPLTSEYDSFINEFSDTQDLLSINVSQPIKRIMKFHEIKDGIPNSFDELGYLDMTAPQKVILDNFINEISI
jgi:hypothetical protein